MGRVVVDCEPFMPSHQERREPLPKGYQFGDASRVEVLSFRRDAFALAMWPLNAIVIESVGWVLVGDRPPSEIVWEP